MRRFGLGSIPWTVAAVLLSTSCGGSESTDVETDPVSEWRTVFSDDFNRGNGPIGSNYFVVLYHVLDNVTTFDASVVNNEVQLTWASQTYFAVRYSQPVTGDTTRVSATFTVREAPSTGSSFSVSARSTYLPSYELTGAYLGGVYDGGIGIFKASSASNPVALVSKAFNLTQGRSYRVELTLRGSDLSFVVKDLTSGATESIAVSDADSPLTGTTFGLNGLVGSGDIIAFDDFLIEEWA